MKKLKKIYEEVSSKNTAAFLKELRSQAERLVKPQAMASLSKLSMDDIARLVHELETHQIELEMQYSELKLVQDALEEINYEYTRLYDDAPVGLLSIDQKGKILKSNVSARYMLNIANSKTSTTLITSFIADEDQDVFYKNKRQALASLNRESCELRLQTKTGKPLWVRLDSICDLDAKRLECTRIRLVLIDISEQKRAEAGLLMEKKKADDAKNLSSELNVKLQAQLAKKGGLQKALNYMDVLDQLTNLPNRTFINEEAFNTISLARTQDELVGLMLISVDDLLSINESGGDLLGDVVVVEAASMIRDSIRDVDIVGRWGSSKFMVILPQPGSIETLQEMARKILAKALTPKLSMVVNALKLSIGLALFPSHAQTTTQLISQAESAMLKAVAAGGNQYVSSD